MDNRSVLVTGASGWIGKNILPLLVGEGFDVVAIYNKNPPSKIYGVQSQKFDLLNIEDQVNIFDIYKPQYLLHLGWGVIPGAYLNNPNNLLYASSTLKLIKQFIENGGKRVVMAGTCFEYAESHNHEINEDYRTDPRSLYAACKNSTREILTSYLQQVGVSFAYGRIFYLYGPGEHPKRLVASVIQSLLRGDIAKCSEGGQVRDFLHVEDVARAFVMLLNSYIRGVVNIASGASVSIKELVSIIGLKLDLLHKIEFGAIESNPNEPKSIVADISLLKRKVDFTPKYSLDSGLDSTIEWWRRNI